MEQQSSGDFIGLVFTTHIETNMTSISKDSTPSNDTKSKIENDHTSSIRLVKVNLSGVTVKTLGNFNIQAQFPSLKPKIERKAVQNLDIEILCAKLYEWFDCNFVLSGREHYFKELMTTIVIFCIYTNPIPELYSDELDLYLKIVGWIWYMDDMVEDAITDKIPFEVFKRGNSKFASIFLGIYDSGESEVEDVAGYPAFMQLFTSLMGLHNICRKTVPGYKKRVLVFHDRLLRFFDCQVAYRIDEIDRRHSVENFCQFRRTIAFFDGTVELVALLHGVTLSDEILRHPTLRRLLDIANGFGGFSNDLCGMKKKFSNGQKDNLIVFKVIEKNVPIEEAAQQVCKLIESDLSDYLLLKESLLKEFYYEENLVRYLDMLDSLCDGHYMLYVHSNRHQCAGSVTLTE